MIDAYRTAVESFHEKLIREYYLHFSGRKPALDLAPVYAESSDLYSDSAISELKTARDQTPAHLPSKGKSLHRLLRFARQQFVDAQTRDLTESIAGGEAQSTLLWDGRPIGYFEAFALLANEGDRDRRRELYVRRTAAVASLRSERRERLRRQVEACRRLGFDNYLAFCSFHRGLDYGRLAQSCRDFLLQTQGLYESNLALALRSELHLELADAHRADVAYFQRLTRFDAFFPAHKMVSAFGETLSGLRIELDRQSNLHIDADARPGKRPRAFCAPIRVPQEVVLVISPRGGHDDFAAFLHEGGHAQHYAWTSPSLPIENRCCGDAALSEVYAFLFNYLILDGRWLSDRLNFDESAPFVSLQQLFKLHMVRRYAAKVRFEVELHSGLLADDAAASARYAELLSAATLFRYQGTEYLEDLDDGLYAADYFRAWIIEAHLEEYLRSRFGKAWFSEARAGAFLREIWETGELYDGQELSAELGLRADDLTPLATMARAGLQNGHH